MLIKTCLVHLLAFYLLSHALAPEEYVTRSQFPADFLFGTASASYQYEGAISEGGKSLSNWDVFTHVQGNILGGGNGDTADDHYHRYMEDIELMQELGVNAYRFSISWSRILPRGRSGNVNTAGIMFYNKIIDNLLARGIQPFVTIHHYDFPHAFEAKYGSWLGPEMQEEFTYLADVCFRSFGDRVKYWATMNELNLVTILSYFTGVYPPARCSRPHGNCSAGNSETEPFIAAHNMILAHVKAVDIYRKHYQPKQGGRIGIVVCATMMQPLTKTGEDIEAAERALAFHVAWILDPLIYGDYPIEMRRILGHHLPRFSFRDSTKMKNSLDFIGINHYSSIYVKDCLHSPCASGGTAAEGFLYKTGERNGVPMGEPTAMPLVYVVPDGMMSIVAYVSRRYNNTPIYVTENGYPDFGGPNRSKAECVNDLKRVYYHKTYLASLSKAMRDGADVRGYFVWSLLDNFEWASGYTLRFGLQYVDFETMKRTPKVSARWYRDFILAKSGSDTQQLAVL